MKKNKKKGVFFILKKRSMAFVAIMMVMFLATPVLALGTHSVLLTFDGEVTGEVRQETADVEAVTLYDGSGVGRISSTTSFKDDHLGQEHSVRVDKVYSPEFSVIKAYRLGFSPADAVYGEEEQIHATMLKAFTGGNLQLYHVINLRDYMFDIENVTSATNGLTKRYIDISWADDDGTYLLHEDMSVTGTFSLMENLNIYLETPASMTWWDLFGK